jgi:uncharacterized membrane protein SirB2
MIVLQPRRASIAVNYLTLKYLHIVCVAASFALFVMRGIWVIRSYPPAQEAWVRVLPHAIDGALLVSAIGLAVLGPKSLWDGNWMTIKLALVVLYVALSVTLLRFSRGALIKLVIWLLAILVFLFTTSVAVLHHPLGIFLLL